MPHANLMVHSPEPVIGSSSKSAIQLGRIVDPFGVAEKIGYDGDQHVLLFGPNGKGKGTRILIPNLLQMSGVSLVVVDPKGELAAVTAPYRRSMGERVVIINPFGVHVDQPAYGDLKSEGFNPLARLNPGDPSFNVKCSRLAEALVERDESREPHWPDSARSLVASLIMYVVIEARRSGNIPTIARVRELLCAAVSEPSKLNDFEGRGLPQTALRMMELLIDGRPIPGLRNKASQFAEWNKEVAGFASTAKVQTESFDDPEIAADLAIDGFDFTELKRRPTTVYITLPPDMAQRHAKWLRLVLTSAIEGVLRARRPGEPKTIFMIDEFFALGRLEIIETVWALTRGYGVKMMPVLQDLNQLKALYPKSWETFTGQAGAIASFAPNDMTTAEWLSRRAGDTTRTVVSYTSGSSTGTGSSTGSGAGSGSTSTSANDNSGSSTSKIKSPLISPHRLIGLRDGFMTLTADGMSDFVPVYAPPYYDILTCAQRARANPYYSAKADDRRAAGDF